MAGLFSPLQVKEYTLKNRIVLPPMANHLAGDSGAVSAGASGGNGGAIQQGGGQGG